MLIIQGLETPAPALGTVLWAKHRWSPGGPPGPLLLKRHLEQRCENGLVWEAARWGHCHGAHLSLASRARPEVKSSWNSTEQRQVCVGLWSTRGAHRSGGGVSSVDTGRRGRMQEVPEGPTGA